MELIREEIEQVEVIVEQRNGKKVCISKVYFSKEISPIEIRECMTATFLREKLADTTNQILYLAEHLVNLDHPDGPTVNLDRVSHKITSLVKNLDLTLLVRQRFLNTQWVRLHHLYSMKV